MRQENFFDRINTFYDKHRLMYTCIVLAVLFFFNCFNVGITWLVMPLLLFFVLVDTLTNGFKYLIFALPFCFVDVNYGCIWMIICVVAYLIKLYYIEYKVEKNQISLTTISLVIAFLLFIILPVRSITGGTFLTLLLVFSVILVFNALLSFPGVFEIHKAARLITLALVISVVYSLSYLTSDFMLEGRIFDYLDNGFLRYIALFAHPNVVAMVCEFTMIVLLYFVFKKKAKIIDYICLGFLAILGISTISKTFLILLAIMIVSLLVFAIIQNWKKGLIFLGCGALAVGLLLIFKWDFVITYLKRFLDLDVLLHGDKEFILDYITTGRYDIWKEYVEYMFEYPLSLVWGMGTVKPRVSILSTHNMYLSIFYQFGIVGVVLLGFVVWKLLYDFKRRTGARFSKSIIIPLVVIGLLLCVEDLILYIY